MPEEEYKKLFGREKARAIYGTASDIYEQVKLELLGLQDIAENLSEVDQNRVLRRVHRIAAKLNDIMHKAEEDLKNYE